MRFHLQKLALRFTLWGIAFVFLASVAGILLNRWLLDRKTSLAPWDTLVIFPVLLAFLIVPFTLALREWVLKPVSRIIEYDRGVATHGIEAGMIPPELIPGDEIGEIMLTHNEMLEGLRGLQGLLEQERSYLDAVVEGLREGVVLLDEMGRVLLSNPAAAELFRKLGLDPPLRDSRLVSIGSFSLEKLHDGVVGANGLSMITVLGEDAGPFIEVWAGNLDVANRQALFLSLRDITEQRSYEQALRDLSLSDPLTNLPNRRSLFEAFPNEIARSRRYETPLSLIILDLDHFKQINDTFGHLAGDNALQQVANLICAVARKTDLPTRYAGDEFVILLPHTALEGAEAFAHRLLDSVHRVSQADGYDLNLSIGAAMLRDSDDAGGDAFLTRADRALYAAKAAGGGRVHPEEPVL